MTPDELLALYDSEVRGRFLDSLPTDWSGSQDGPLARAVSPRSGFAQLIRPADDLGADELRALVTRTVEFYSARGLWFEWKTFDHDRADLVPLLLEAGAEAEEHEALVLGDASLLVTAPALAPGLAVREVSDGDDLRRIAALQTEVWGEDWSWLAAELESRVADPREPARVFVVEDEEVPDGSGHRVVSAAWLVPVVGTRFAGLWGGSTLREYRGRGSYRALVARRARLALELGHSILQVDASDESRPILERLGLHVVGGTTPYVIGRS